MIARLRQTRAGRTGLVLGGIAGGLLVLDLIGLAITFYFHDEILAQAEAAGLGNLLKP
jgi:hypothetical protein